MDNNINKLQINMALLDIFIALFASLPAVTSLELYLLLSCNWSEAVTRLLNSS
jgi:hypothetical protein